MGFFDSFNPVQIVKDIVEPIPVVGDIVETGVDIVEGTGTMIGGGIGAGLESIGLDEDLAGGIGAGAGTFLGGFGLGDPTAFFRGIEEGVRTKRRISDQIESERELAEQDDRVRQAFNNKIFNTAQDLTGSFAQNPFFDISTLAFEGDDPREDQLLDLTENLTRRQTSLVEGISRPGERQTRLSMV